MIKKYDFIYITEENKIAARCENICKIYNYHGNRYNNIDTLITDAPECRVLLMGGITFPNGGEMVAMLSKLRVEIPDTFILFIETKNSLANSIKIAKDYGSNLAMTEAEFYETSKPEFITSQVIRATFLPIKPSDITANKEIQFNLYHLLPQRQKFLKFCFTGDQIDEKKLEKIKSIDEIYIHRDDAAKFAKYISLYADNSEDGLNKLCRSQFISLYTNYINLVFLLTDQSETGSFQTGNELIDKCKEIANTLLAILQDHPNAWSIINKAIIGDFGSLERAPAVSAYAGIIALRLGMKTIEELMLCVLISEIGILYLPQKVSDCIREDTLDLLTKEEKSIYQKYPLKSLAIALDRKVQLSESLRNIITTVHEQADKNGFPGKKSGNHIPNEAYIIHFAFALDQKTSVKLGKPQISFNEGIRQLIDQETASPAHFTPGMILKLRMAMKREIDQITASSS